MTNEWIKTPWYIYTKKYYTATRKDKFLLFAMTWMLSEINQREGDKNLSLINDFTYLR